MYIYKNHSLYDSFNNVRQLGAELGLLLHVLSKINMVNIFTGFSL